MIGWLTGRTALFVVVAATMFGWIQHQQNKAYDRGYAAADAKWKLAMADAQKKHDAKVAAKEAEINQISRKNSEAIFKLASEYSTIQLQLLELPDEDYLCGADEPVFSDRLLEHINKIGRD